MHDWVLVLVSDLFCVGSVAWISASTLSKVNTLKGRILGRIVWLLPPGLLYGILYIFRWHRAFHPPLIFITVLAFAGMIMPRFFAIKAWLLR